MRKIVVVNGWVREDNFGRVVIDRCCSDDDAHLQSSVTDPETNKPGCRFLLEEFFTRGKLGAEMIGHRGTMSVTIDFEPEIDGGIADAVQKYIEERAAA